MTSNEKSPMAEALHTIANLAAPESYINWRLYEAGGPRLTIVEAAIYTDTWLLGEYLTGPLAFLNTLADGHRPDSFRPGIVLRFTCCWPPRSYSGAFETNDDHYHGGNYLDEIAALISVILGIRAQAGPITREFSEGGDPLGRPIMLTSMKAIPVLGTTVRNPIVPRLRQPANLAELRMIERIPTLTDKEAVAVVKAARTYQSALWFADANPETAWLFLVSAIETAASYWSNDQENFKDHDDVLASDIHELLDKHNCPASVYLPLANLLRTKNKATRKFLKFLEVFLPGPPPDRERAVHEALRMDYRPALLSKDFNWIYTRRSKALHDSIPFPNPLCVPPTQGINEERAVSLGASALGATWDFRKYKPLMFHTFEHIVRGALQNWIKSLGTQPKS